MSKIFATAGSKIDIGPAKVFDDTDFLATDFTTGSPVWSELGGLTNLGSAGGTNALVSSEHITPARTRKAKGTRNEGTMTVVMDLDYSDAGQLAVIAAEKVKETYAFRVTFNDAPVGGTPSVRYFAALVMSASEQWDEANSMMKLNVSLEIDSNIVRVAAAAGGG